MVEHYFSKKQTSEFRPEKVVIRIKGLETKFFTAGGVFSPKKLDKGSQLLIEKSEIEPDQTVLDLGCGYGVTGILVKRLHPKSEVVFSDVNERAIKLTKMNLRLHNIKANAYQSDGFNNQNLDEMKFDTILLNPPQTAGKEVCFRLFEESKSHLKKGGTLQIVARTKKGGRLLSEKMKEIFGNVHDTAKGSGFRIYISKNI